MGLLACNFETVLIRRRLPRLGRPSPHSVVRRRLTSWRTCSARRRRMPRPKTEGSASLGGRAEAAFRVRSRVRDRGPSGPFSRLRRLALVYFPCSQAGKTTQKEGIRGNGSKVKPARKLAWMLGFRTFWNLRECLTGRLIIRWSQVQALHGLPFHTASTLKSLYQNGSTLFLFMGRCQTVARFWCATLFT